MRSILGHVRRLLERDVTTWGIIALAVMLTLPAATTGFVSDDDMLIAALAGRRLDAPHWNDLYAMLGRAVPTLVDRGVLPWWSAKGARLHLLRPVPSALLTLDYALFGRAAFAYHLHSTAWFLALLLVARRFFLRVLSRPTATLSLFIFALTPIFCMPTRWIAARHIIVAAVPTVLGLLFLVESDERPRRRWLAISAFVAGLLCCEIALGGLALFAAYEWLGRGERPRRERLERLVAPMAIGIVYLVIYSALGYGARSIDHYVDPISDPIGFLRAAAFRVPLLLGDALWLIEAALGVLAPLPVLVADLFFLAVTAALFRSIWPAVPAVERAALRWLVPGVILATFGVVGGMPGGRELAIVGVGVAPFVAVILCYGWARTGANGRAPWLRRTGVVLLAILHLLLGPIAALGKWAFIFQVDQATEKAAHDMARAAGTAERVVLLTAADPTVWVYGMLLARAEHQNQVPTACWWVLSAARGEHRVESSSPRTLSLTTIDTTLLKEPFEGLFRRSTIPFAKAQEVTQCGAVIRVEDLRDGFPSRLSVQMDMDLYDPRVAFLAWRDGAIARVSPSELATGLSISYSVGPVGF